MLKIVKYTRLNGVKEVFSWQTLQPRMLERLFLIPEWNFYGKVWQLREHFYKRGDRI